MNPLHFKTNPLRTKPLIQGTAEEEPQLETTTRSGLGALTYRLDSNCIITEKSWSLLKMLLTAHSICWLSILPSVRESPDAFASPDTFGEVFPVEGTRSW